MSACTVYGKVCPEHGFIHGAEAEELRKGIELILRRPALPHRLALIELLDRTNARDSLAYLEAKARK